MGGVLFFFAGRDCGCLISLFCTSVRLQDAPDCGRAPYSSFVAGLNPNSRDPLDVPGWEFTEKLPTRVASRTSDGLIDAAC